MPVTSVNTENHLNDMIESAKAEAERAVRFAYEQHGKVSLNVERETISYPDSDPNDGMVWTQPTGRTTIVVDG